MGGNCSDTVLPSFNVRLAGDHATELIEHQQVQLGKFLPELQRSEFFLDFHGQGEVLRHAEKGAQLTIAQIGSKVNSD